MLKTIKNSSAVALGVALAMGSGFAQAEGSCNPFCVDFTGTYGYGVSANRVNIEGIRVDFEVPNPFGGPPTLTSTYYNVAFDFDIASLHLIPAGIVDTSDQSDYCASLTVIVTDAFSGNALSNAPVTVSGETVWTDANGQATLSNLFAGDAYVQASGDGYTTAERTVTLDCAAPSTVALSLSPTTGDGALATNEVRVVLSWGENPRDLDSHLTGPMAGDISDENRFHVAYYARNADEVASLDVDDVSSYGPETVTIVPPSGSSTLRPGTYRYSVHHYSGDGSMCTSPTSVDLIFGNGQTRQFSPSGSCLGDEDVWTVFELIVNTDGTVLVSPVDTMSSGTSEIRDASTTTGYGSVETGVDFARQPGK